MLCFLYFIFAASGSVALPRTASSLGDRSLIRCDRSVHLEQSDVTTSSS